MMTEKRKKSRVGILAKINLVLFILIALPAILSSVYCYSSSQIWSGKLPLVFLEFLAYPFFILVVIGILVDAVGLVTRKTNVLSNLVIHLFLLTVYIMLVTGCIRAFLKV